MAPAANTVLTDWSLAAQVMLGQATNGQCAPPIVAQPGNGVCDQFGASCRMWECPDAFDVGNGTWAFKWSDQVGFSLHVGMILQQSIL